LRRKDLRASLNKHPCFPLNFGVCESAHFPEGFGKTRVNATLAPRGC